MKTKISLGMIFIGMLMMSIFLIGCDKAGKAPTTEEAAPKPAVAEVPKETPPEMTQPVVEEVKPAMHTVKFVGNKFEPAELTIKVGDTVVWKNERDSPTLNKAMVLGTKTCTVVKSSLLKSGDTFEWTFTEPGTCQVVDGILTSNWGKIVVEE